MNDRTIFIVSYAYQPDPSPRAFRWSAIAEYWAAQEHDVEVLCSRRSHRPAEQRRNGVLVHSAGEGLLGFLRRRIGGKPGECREVLAAGESDGPRRSGAEGIAGLSGAMRRAAVWSYDHTWKKLWWPDYAALWYFPALRQARELISRQGCGALITSSLPFTDHLVGLQIKREHPALPWIVDIGDPFCFCAENPNNNLAIYRHLNEHVERKVFESADAIAVTTAATQRLYAELFPRAADRIHVIPPLVRSKPQSCVCEKLFPADGRIRLAYFGRLYAGIRSPERLLSMFRKLLETPLGEKLELHFFGWTGGCEAFFEPYQSLLGKRLFLHGSVDHSTARQAMGAADFLVNIGNTTAHQLPSKLVEYAQTGRPILNLAGSPEDSSALFLRPYRAALSLFPREGSAEARQWAELLEFLQRPPQVPQGELRRWLETFEARSIAGRYEALIEEARSRKRSTDVPAARRGGETLVGRPTILTFTDGYLPGCKLGGPVRSLANMVSSMSSDVRFRVVTRDRDLGDTEPYPNCAVNAWQRLGKADVMYLPPREQTFASLRRLINTSAHDVLYLNSLFSRVFTIMPLALRRLHLVTRKPVVLAPRGELSPGALAIKSLKKRVYLAMVKAIGLYEDVIWQATSELEEQDIRRWFGRAHVCLAPNLCVFPPSDARLPAARRKEPGMLSVAFLSRISRNKNLDGALEMLQGLRGTVEFHIYGPHEDAAYWKQCTQLMERLPTGITAISHGPVTHERILDALRQHHLFLLPTHGENFGHAILEALLAGCPLLISDQTPWRGLERKGVGWDLPLGQPGQFQHVLQQCIAMDDRTFQTLSQQAEQYGMSMVRDGHVLEQNLHVFQAAAGRRRSAA